MRHLTLPLFLIALVAIAGGVAWYLMASSAAVRNPMPENLEDGNNLAIYTNGIYGFSVMYPELSEIEYAFLPERRLPETWRSSAIPAATGTPILSITPYYTESERSYPRHFVALVRVSASSDPKELAACEKPTPDQAETALSDRVISGRTWKAFSFQDAGMMQFRQGVSYRTIHEGKCIALEKIQAGSSYREEESPSDIPDEVLRKEFEALDAIIESFSFAR